jgi:3-oxoacyl-[acyl-carrier protein] reductase
MSDIAANGLLAGKAAIVTGGGQGIGAAIARLFAQHGAQVVIGDVRGEAATRTAEEIGPCSSVIGKACNVTDEDDMASLVARCRDAFGRVDVLVNNAGITRDATMRKMSVADFRAVIDVHLTGTWLGTRTAGLVMREQGRGVIVNMSSMSGKVGNVGQTNYSAAKAGIIGLTKAAAKELAPFGVRVNAIQPGLVRTAMTEAMPRDVLEARMAEIPLKRIGEPDDVANVALFLASDLSSYMTGSVVEVSGGRNM